MGRRRMARHCLKAPAVPTVDQRSMRLGHGASCWAVLVTWLATGSIGMLVLVWAVATLKPGEMTNLGVAMIERRDGVAWWLLVYQRCPVVGVVRTEIRWPEPLDEDRGWKGRAVSGLVDEGHRSEPWVPTADHQTERQHATWTEEIDRQKCQSRPSALPSSPCSVACVLARRGFRTRSQVRTRTLCAGAHMWRRKVAHRHT